PVSSSATTAGSMARWYNEPDPAFSFIEGLETTAKAYWVVCYRSISDPRARENYSKLGAPAVLAAGGRFGWSSQFLLAHLLANYSIRGSTRSDGTNYSCLKMPDFRH